MPTGRGLRIGKILGIPIYVDLSWLLVFGFFTYMIQAEFRHVYPRWSGNQVWGVAALTCLLFFASVVFHELAHSMVARLYKIEVASITLFLFGGVAHVQREPPKAMQEFNIAIAGPVSSGILAALFFVGASFYAHNEKVLASATWLWEMNASLAIFNLLPGFPLDGGRIFRSIVWGVTGNFSKATRVAGLAGKWIAYAMIVLGVFLAFGGSTTAGLWTAFIGWFLLNAAQESVAQVQVRETLAGLRAMDVMSSEVPTIARDISLEDYGAEVLRTGRRCHLVVTDDRLVGMMNVHTLNSVPRDEWPHMSVQAVMIARDKILWATPQEPLLKLLERLLAADVNQVPVVSGSDGGNTHVVGMVTRDSILRVMQTRSELASSLTGR